MEPIPEEAPVCSTCGSRRMRLVIWGMPAPDEEFTLDGYPEWIEGFEFGGCMIPPDPRLFRCTECGQPAGPSFPFGS